MLDRLAPLALLLSLLLVACGGDETKSDSGACGSGTAIEYADESHCLFDKGRVIESAFVCPSDTPSIYTNDSSDCIVCSPDEELSNTELSVICDDWGDETVEDAGSMGDGGNADAGNTDDSGASTDAGGCQSSSVGGNCDPFCQTGCGDGLHCTIGGGAAGVMAQCIVEGNSTQDEVCDNTERCAAGYICMLLETGGSVGNCHKICRPGSDDAPQCDEGAVCQPIPNTDAGLCITT